MPRSPFCYRCKERPRGGPTEAYCKPCRREYDIANRERRKLQIKAANESYYKINDEAIRKAKSVPCADCGVSYPYYVMDFDHVRGEKRQNLSAMRTCPPQAVLDEIAKCDVVCSNCHRERTWQRVKARAQA